MLFLVYNRVLYDELLCFVPTKNLASERRTILRKSFLRVSSASRWLEYIVCILWWISYANEVLERKVWKNRYKGRMHQETLKSLKDYLECKDLSNGIWAWMAHRIYIYARSFGCKRVKVRLLSNTKFNILGPNRLICKCYNKYDSNVNTFCSCYISIKFLWKIATDYFNYSNKSTTPTNKTDHFPDP